MNLGELFLIIAGAVMLIGIFGMLTRSNIIKILLSINILQTGVNLLIVAIGWVKGGSAPIITKSVKAGSIFVDPLPQALVLTAIVIAFGTTAVGLVLCINYFKSRKTLEMHSFGKEGNKMEDEVVQ